MKQYESLFRHYKDQSMDKVFAHAYPIKEDPELPLPPTQDEYDEPFRLVARSTMDSYDAWAFLQPRFRKKYSNTAVPKLRNYLNYTFVRLLELEQKEPGRYFVFNADQQWCSFNTGLQNQHGSDLLAVFQKFIPREAPKDRVFPDWVFKGCFAPNDRQYRDHFGKQVPDIAWYSLESRDYIFDTSYSLQKDVFDHLFDRAKERAGMPNASDEIVRNYLRGAIENLIPKIKRNYKIAIPVYYVEEKRMQLLLPFASVNNQEVSAFLVERDDADRNYRIKTIFDLDHAYFSARLITRPDKEWLNP